MEDPKTPADAPAAEQVVAEVEMEDPRSGSEKRGAENGGDGEFDVRSGKKARPCGERGMRRVAEIVLVLSAMAEVRGGRKPTPEEAGLMVEARDKLAEMCLELAPKDIVPREAVESVIEDLGLNAIGFKGTRLTIAEKMVVAKKKIEDSKKFTAHPTTYSSHPLQTSYGTAAENRGTNPIRSITSDKQIHNPIHSGSFPASTPLGHVHSAPSTSLPYQLPANEVRASGVSSGLPGSNLGRASSLAALHKVERGQFKVDGGSNGTSYAAQVRANSSAERPLVNAPTWSLHSQSATSAKTGLHQTPAKVEGTADTNFAQMGPQGARDQTFRPFSTQTPLNTLSHQPLPAMNLAHSTSSHNHHYEISKIVQNVLQPHLPEHPTWTPPSRDYMSKPLSCQMCQHSITEVETVLLCDACEKGYHMQCLQPFNQKGIPRGAEWHCPKCLQLSNGKPLPPKYGRVMRNLSSLKTPSISTGVQPSSEKKGNSDLKASQQKITANGSNTVQSSTLTSTNISNHVDVPSSSKIPNVGGMQGNNLSAKQIGSQHIQPSESSEPVPESKQLSTAESSDTVNDKIDHLLSSDNPQNADWTAPPQCVELASKNKNSVVRGSDMSSTENVDTNKACDSKVDDLGISHPSKNDNSTVRDSDKSLTADNVDATSICSANGDDLDISEPISSNVTGECALSSDSLHDVGWIGDAFQVVDGKTFYRSCCVGGVSYKVQDHVLFHFSHDKLAPSKLQAMWEDIKTGSKWVIVNRCYFPSDLPEVVGCPPAPESNEVYESNHDITMMAGLIQGPCKIVRTTNFREENIRRDQTDTGANQAKCPIFLCKWLYDEPKGSFQPISS